MRHHFLLLVLLVSFCGCMMKTTAPTTASTPVVVDEAAAYPSQEPGTKPPVLTGFSQLTKEQLDEGWVQAFDGVSSYGWSIKEGEGKIVVYSRDNVNFLGGEETDGPEKVFKHNFTNLMYNGKDFVGLKGWATTLKNTSDDFSIRVKPNDLQPLAEADWKAASGKCEAKWADGVLELTGGSGMVETAKEYGDFVLQLEYFTEKGINSGVFFRCIPGENMNGYECQIFNSPPDGDYEKFIGTDTGGLFRRQVGRNVGAKDGEWNYMTVAAKGEKFATWVNGIQTTDWTDDRAEHDNPRNGKRLKPGTIQLQGHDPTTKIQFRNFRIAEITE